MATIGRISVAFGVDLGELNKGIDKAIDRFDEITKSVESLSDTLDDLSGKVIEIAVRADTSAAERALKSVADVDDLATEIKVTAAVDTSDVTDARKKVRQESKEIESASPKVKVRVDSNFLSGFYKSLASQVKEASEGVVEFGEEAGSAFKSVGSAANAIGDVVDGTATSIDGLVTAAGRANVAYGKYREVVDAAVGATSGFIVAAGGLRSIVLATGGSMAAAAKVGGALAGTLAAGAAGAVTYAAVMGVARVATAGLSEEARGYANAAASVVAATAAATVSAVSLGAVSKTVASAIWSSSSASEALSKTLSALGGAAASAGRSLVQNFASVAAAFAAVNVASGKFSEAMQRIGAEAESTRNMSERFGTSVEQMQVLGFAADAAGVSMGQLAKAQQAFYTSVGKIKIGQLNTETTKEAKLAFDKLGISLEDIRNKSPQEIFAIVGDELNKVTDASERTAIAFDLFGKQGGNILPALRGLKDASADAARLGTVMSKSNFRMFEGVDQSFDRLKEASKNLSSTMLVAFAPLQTGFNNLMAEIKGGLAAALEPMRSLFAAATVPLQVMLEVVGRLINIFLRLVGVVAKFATAASNAPAIAVAWSALGDVVKAVLVPFEEVVSVLEKIASVFMDAVTPAVDGATSVFDKLVFAVKTFAATVVTAGVASAVMQSFGMQAGVAFSTFAKGLLSVDFAAWGKTVLSTLRLITVGVAQTAITAVKNFTLMGISAIANFVTPAVTGVATFIASITGASAASLIAATGMAAAWAIASLGLTLLISGAIAVYQNFDELADYFANFGENVKKLFTFEGAADAAKAVAGAIWNAFKSILGGIGGFIGAIIAKITGAFQSIEPPPAIDAAKASAEEIVKQRQRTAQAKFDQTRTVQVQFDAMGLGAAAPEPVKPPTEDYDAMAQSIKDGRSQLAALSFEAARFGDKGKTAALEAQKNFNKLLDSLSKGEISPQKFEESAKKIQKSLRENIAIEDVISPEEVQQFLSTLQDASKQAAKAVRDISAGTVVEGKFFPTSDSIKRQADEFKAEYDARLREIARMASEGAFGEGDQGKQNMLAAQEDAARQFQRNMDTVSRDMSFADNIRKELETAFLSPVEQFQKELDKIRSNKSLQGPERTLAEQNLRRQARENLVGKSASQQFQDRQRDLNQGSQQGLISPEELSVELQKNANTLAQALGIPVKPSSELDIALANLQTAVEDGSISMQAFVDGTKAARDKFLASLGISKRPEDTDRERLRGLQENAGRLSQDELARGRRELEASIIGESSADRFAAQRQRIESGIQSGAVSRGRGEAALRSLDVEQKQAAGLKPSAVQLLAVSVDKVNDAFGVSGRTLSQIQATLSPEQFESYQEAVSDARDSFLQSIGIATDPMSEFSDLMDDMNEALQQGIITQEEFAKGAADQRKKLADSLGIREDPSIKLTKDIQELEKLRKETRDKIDPLTGRPVIDPATGKPVQERVFTDAQIDRAIQDKRDAALPGTVDRTVRNFVDDSQTLDRAQFGRTQREMAAEANRIRSGQLDFGDLKRMGELMLQGLNPKQVQAQLVREVGMSKSQKEIGDIVRNARSEGRQLTGEERQKIATLRQQDSEFAERRLSLQADLQDQLKAEFGPDRRVTQGSDIRSKEGVDTFFRLVQGQDNPSLKAQLESARTLRNIYQALSEPESAPVVAQLAAR